MTTSQSTFMVKPGIGVINPQSKTDISIALVSGRLFSPRLY
jgi:hypothetical protein